MTNRRLCAALPLLFGLVLPLGGGHAGEVFAAYLAVPAPEYRALPSYSGLAHEQAQDDSLDGLVEGAFAAFEKGNYSLARSRFAKAQKTLASLVRARDETFIGGLTTASDLVSLYPSYAGDGSEKGPTNGMREQALLFYMRGLSELRLGDARAANKSFRKALSRNDKLHLARADLAYLYALDGDETKARRNLKKLKSQLDRCDGDCRLTPGLNTHIALAEAAIDESFTGWAPRRLE